MRHIHKGTKAQGVGANGFDGPARVSHICGIEALFRGVFGPLHSIFFSFTLYFLAKWFQFHTLCSRKKDGDVKAPKEVLHKL
jgi:hypothetical protein